MPGGSAYRPDDILRARNGKTIEVNNTDAEGRLTLADALCYASELKPDMIVDIATLTGACAVALGSTTAGLFTNNDEFGDKVLKASAASGERFWKLPMDDPNLRELIKSPFADLVNSGGRYGGAMAVGDGIDGVGARQMYLDIKTPLNDWIDHVRKFKPNIIIGYPSAIKILAELVEAGKVQVQIKRVISCGEPLSAGLRKLLEKNFLSHPTFFSEIRIV